MSDPRRHPFRFDPAWLSALALLGVLGYLPGLELMRLIFLLFPFGLLARALQHRQRRANDHTATSIPDLPLNEPARRGGPLRFVARLFVSQMLILLNPLQMAQIVAQIVGQAVVSRRTLPGPGYIQRARYTLPFRGEWLVYNGGATPATSHSWDVLTQRYAYDFVVADAALRRHHGEGCVVTDYFCYSREIIAPADGEVISARDGVRDAPRPGSGWLDFLSPDFRGNFVIIKHAEGEYSFLAHLIPGSICVRPGQHVQCGQTIGQCGNSGHSTEPHLHFHVQDRPSFWLAAGVPVKFDDVAVDGVLQVNPAYLSRGERVAAR